jgi:hypothetical protein
MNVQPFLFGAGWIEVRDGDASARDIFERHYTARPDRDSALIVGPGFKLVLITADAGAICAWRREKYRVDGQDGIECCIFRREAGELASDLLASAMRAAWSRFPGERFFTFVDPVKVKPTWRAGRPTWGHCFYLAGWRFAGLTKKRLHILECRPEWVLA